MGLSKGSVVVGDVKGWMRRRALVVFVSSVPLLVYYSPNVHGERVDPMTADRVGRLEVPRSCSDIM